MATEQDIQDVIKTLIAEGIGEGEEGMRRIAETILNRAEQRGISPGEVVRQRAQYTGYSNPGPAAVRAQSDPNALSAAQAAWQLAQGPDDPTGGANHYWNPNIVNPSWAGSMQSLGQFGNHAFATDRPVQRRAPVAPNPVSQAPLMAASRALTSPSGGNSGLAPALQSYATREGNRVTPASVEDRVTARNKAPLMAASAFGDDPGTRSNGPVVATIPSRPNTSAAMRRAALSIGANQTYVGQERMPALAAAAIGQPPATRIVPTTTVRSGNVSANVNDQRAEQLATRAPARQAVAAIAQDAAKAVAAPQLTQQQRLAILGTAQREDRLPSTLLPINQPMPAFQPGPYSAATVLPTVNAAGQRMTAPAPIQQASLAPVPAQRSTLAPLMSASAQASQPMQRQIAPRQAAPLMAASRQPLRIVVQGAQAQQPSSPAPSTWAPQGYTNDGAGRITNNETGGVYYERHLRR